MKRINLVAGAAALLAAVVVAIVVTATATAVPPPQTQPCTSSITGINVGNVTVPSGGSCTLRNLTVNGNITVQGGTLWLYGVTVNGNITVQPGSHVYFGCYYGTQGNHVTGNLWSSGAAVLGFGGGCTQRIDGNMWIDGTASGPYNSNSDTLIVGGNVTLTHNTGQSLHHLTVGANFVCFSDTPTPSVFLPYSIGGSKTPNPNACLQVV